MKKEMKNKNKKRMIRTAAAIAVLMMLFCGKKYIQGLSAAKNTAEEDGAAGSTVAVIEDGSTPLASAADVIDDTQESAKPQAFSATGTTTVTAENTQAPVQNNAPIVNAGENSGSTVTETPDADNNSGSTDTETPDTGSDSTEPELPNDGATAPDEDAPVVTESTAHLGIAWLVEQLNTNGTVVNSYFANRGAKSSLDSNGKNFAPDVNTALEAAGIVSAETGYGWRIYKGTPEAGYNVFFAAEELVKNETVDASKYNTVSEEMQDGTVDVTSKTVEGSTFAVIDGASFTETAPQETAPEASEGEQE